MSGKTNTMAWDPRALVRKTFRRIDNDGLRLGPHWPQLETDQIESRTQPAPTETGIRQAILRTRQWLLAQQHVDGYWVGELEGDSILESEYILLLAFLGQEQSEIARKCGSYLLKKQLPEGGWTQYPGGSIDVSASVKAYFALKLIGQDPSSEPMARARAAILAHGGADAVNSFTRFYLALLGQIGYEHCPSVPPEFVLLPKWFPINLYAVSAWSRTIIVPLSIMSSRKPVRAVAPSRGIRELFLREPRDWPPLRCPGLKRGTRLLSWDRFFRTVDASLKFLERNRLLPCREKAIRAATRWMIERFDGSDGLGAIFPPMVWSVIALRCLGHNDDTVEMRYCIERLEGLIIEDDDSARLQPCKSPVWDTAITLRALTDSGVPADDHAVQSATDWLLDNEVHVRGDWAKTVKCEPGGWCFEHANQFYPDLDDTAMVVMALNTQFADGIRETIRSLPPPLAVFDEHQTPRWTEPDTRLERLDRTLAAIARAEKWMLAMQNRDGGWGAFDRDNDRQFLCYVPFADHNAMIDPSTPDLAARVLEALAHLGKRVGDAAVDRAVNYLRATQQSDGSWFGRWGVNYIYGTWQTLVGLSAAGVPHDDPAIVAGANWLITHQQPGGGWGESADSYAEPHKRGQGPVTASQSAWAILGLMSAGRTDHPAVTLGIAWLLEHQRADGTWHEAEFTGTGFPRVFYLRYHMYPIYFPLMALSKYAANATRRI
jgi:squalene-hopene/tetraprenyl-beta-curcumene cyclase